MTKKIKVYYNSACPVCDAGIKSQKGRMEACRINNPVYRDALKSADGITVEWIDIAHNPKVLQTLGVSREAVRERLHVVDETDTTQVGIDAFAVLWVYTPRLKLLAHFVRLPVIHTLARLIYNAFAAGLYYRNTKKGRWTVET
jgi:predicted DCC family thiol-disulfide oxidoreductase YuxK